MPPDPEVLDFFRRAWQEYPVNQEALHLAAYRCRQVLADAEKRLARTLTGNENDSVLWSDSATGIFRMLGNAPCCKNAVISSLEHPAAAANFRAVLKCRADASGRIIPEAAEKVDAVCFHQVQSELGVVQDLSSLFAAYPGACRIVDAVQAAGKMPLYAGADVLVVSGAKFGSPGGAAAIIAEKSPFAGVLLKHAGKFRHADYAAGRVCVPQALTMSFAAEKMAAAMNSAAETAAILKSRIIRRCAAWQIVPTIPECVPQSPFILNLTLPHQQSAIVVRALSAAGVHTAAGSACSAESDSPSAALLAIGRNKNTAYRGLRISFAPSTGSDEVDFFLFQLENVLKNY